MSNIINVDINKEMKEAYLQYSMSVIVGRALPDVRDGFKPVHRRILFAMHNLSNTYDKPYKKSARVVGDVIGKYHPHGESAVYDAIVRMAQDFSLRNPLIDGQGNFGSIDGDRAAAQRYTEIRMAALSGELLEDIEKDTVDYEYNYDDSLLMPKVLPAKFPNLLLNGSSGIAVGMATNIPPHNLNEIIDACLLLIQNPKASLDEVCYLVKGPDFPTGGVILGQSGIQQALKTGRGSIKVRSKVEIEDHNKKTRIVVSEIPYQVNKSRLIEGIALLVKDKKVQGISDIRDESSREGLRIVIDVKKGEDANVILNQLYKYSKLQTSYGIILLALDEKNNPKIFNIKTAVESFLEHRKEIIVRRSLFELKKYRERAHILEGLRKALNHIDDIITLIKSSKNTEEARNKLTQTYEFTEPQVKAILEMRLQKLTALEQNKLDAELQELLDKINWLESVLADTKKVYDIIAEDLKYIKDKYGSSRRTDIDPSADDFTLDDESLIQDEDVVISITKEGEVKKTSINEYKVQKRGGVGLKGGNIRSEGDSIWKLLQVSNLTNLLFFSNEGTVYWLKPYRLPMKTRTNKGNSVRNIIPLGQNEKVCSILPVQSYEDGGYILFSTKKGQIKKTSVKEYSRKRQSGLIAFSLNDGDQLVATDLCYENYLIMMVSSFGQSILFKQNEVRAMGRNTKGIIGMKLRKDDFVIDCLVAENQTDKSLLTITRYGYGKRTPISDFRVSGRSGLGVVCHKLSSDQDRVVGAKILSANDEILITTNTGQTIRTTCDGISQFGRASKGVRIMKLKSDEYIVDFTVLNPIES